MKTIYHTMESHNRKIILKDPQILMRVITMTQHFINFESMRTNIFIIIACTFSGLAFSQTRTTIVNTTATAQKIEQINAVETPMIGDTKNDIQSTDHNGWYLMNGRAIADLPVSLQKKANTLGFKEHLGEAEKASLPNTDRSGSVSGRSGSVSGRSGTVSGKSASESPAVISNVTSNRFIYLGE